MSSNRLPSNLPQLQNLIKRDSKSYIEEFERQYALYTASKLIFEQNPSTYSEQLHELVTFLAQVSHCYPKELENYPEDLASFLRRHRSVLHPDMRMAFVRALVLLRNKNLLAPTALLVLLFQLLRCHDKNLRKFLLWHIVTDIKNINSKSKNVRLNKELQNFMFEMLKDSHPVAAKVSLDVMITLYKKQIWNDAKTVNIISMACFSKVTKIMVAALTFFISSDKKPDSDGSDSDGDDVPDLKSVQMAIRVNKKTKNKGNKKVEKTKAAIKKNKKRKLNKANFDFSAIHLINDPQDLAERLYKKLDKLNERFEVKLMMMNFISRLIGIHELYLPNFYAYLQRYLFPRQKEVTKVMVYAAQAAHPLVPPNELEPLLHTLANNFVTERYSGEVISMGLNTIRELCSRNPFCMTEDLLPDLAQYKSHKDKGVMMAARSLIMLFREKNPQLLVKKDRGAPSELTSEEKPREFGVSTARSYIPGAEILTVDQEAEADEGEEGNTSDDDWIDVSEPEADETSSAATGPSYVNGNQSAPSKKKVLDEIMKFTPEERVAKASDVVTSRFLTDDDFAKIEKMQAAKQVHRFSKSNKRKSCETAVKANDEIVTLDSIEMIYKKRRHDKESRLESAKAGREDRPAHGSRKGKLNPFASTTNKEKNRKKAFMMVKHKARRKKKWSFREKQMRLKHAMLKQKKNY